MNGGSRDSRRACGDLLEPVGTSFAGFSGLCKKVCSRAFAGITKKKRINTCCS